MVGASHVHRHQTPERSPDPFDSRHSNRRLPPTTAMGICKPGYTSIHSIVSSLPENCRIDHSFSGEHQFWTFYFTLKPSFERQFDEVALGRVNNVVGVVRLTREM